MKESRGGEKRTRFVRGIRALIASYGDSTRDLRDFTVSREPKPRKSRR